jgi:hypothetical protein
MGKLAQSVAERRLPAGLASIRSPEGLRMLKRSFTTLSETTL